MTSRFKGSGREKEAGFLATHKHDHISHVQGEDWRHDATHIDMGPAITEFSHPTVQGTLELIASFAQTVGTGFVSIGDAGADGYGGTDGYGTGSYNVGTDATPTLADAMAAAVADDRLQNGGIILLISGTYRVTETITIPPGITLMGENASTIIIGDTADLPIFTLQRGLTYPGLGGNEGAGDIPALEGAPIDETKLMNLIMADNLDGYNTNGPTMTTSSMIEMERSSRVVIENVKFLGQVADSAPTASGRDKTARAIGVTTGGTTGTYLTLKSCYFDGLETAGDFAANGGDLDFLVVEDCRARTFGTESSVTVDVDRNCFISMSLCNARLVNNHHVGYGTFPTQIVGSMFVVSSIGASNNVSVSVVGNTGGPSSGMDTSAVYFAGNVVGAAGTNVKASLTGNSWGSALQNPWFVTVAEGSSIGDDVVADFTGPGAIDLLLSVGLTYPVTVVVHSGTYTVTENNALGFNFIASQRRNDARPILDLNVSGTTDEVSNNTFLIGLILEGIHFRSSSGTSFQSVRPGGGSGVSTHGVKVENCVFEDVGLSVDNTIALSTNNNFVDIINCRFEQSGDFDDNISLLLPILEHIKLSGCLFTGYGYAGLIGEDSSISYTNNKTKCKIIIEDCQFDQVGFSIDDASPLSTEAYLVINNDLGQLNIKDSTWIVESDLETSAVASATRRGGAGDFESYLNFTADSIDISNSLFNCGHGTWTDGSGDTWVMPGLKAQPLSKMLMSNCRVMQSLIQVGGTAASLSGADADGVIIENCQFKTTDNTTYSGQTMFDVDLDPTVTPDDAKVLITNSSFYINGRSEPEAVKHNLLGVYTTYGGIQVYGDEYNVNLNNNDIYVNIASTWAASSNVVGVAVFNGTPTKDGPNSLFIKDNTIVVDNNLSTVTATDVAAGAYVNCTDLIIQGNLFRTINGASVSSSIICCLYILNTSPDGTSPAVVSENIFSRAGGGGDTDLNLGYVNIDGSATKGTLYNNTFNSTTLDGTDESVVENGSANWTSRDNVNELYTIVANGEFGLFAASDEGSGEDVYPAGAGSQISSYISVDITDGTTPVIFNYVDTGVRAIFKWALPLYGLIPIGATVTEVTVDVSVNASPTTSNSRLTIREETADTLTLTTAGDGLSGTHTVSSAHQIGNGPEYIELFYEVNDAGNKVYSVSPITIKYRL